MAKRESSSGCFDPSVVPTPTWHWRWCTRDFLPSFWRLHHLLRLTALALIFAAASEAAQDSSQNVDRIASLRAQITTSEEASEYAAMVLAATELRNIAIRPEDRVFALRSIGRAYMAIGDNEQSLSAMAEAVEIAEADMSPELLVEVQLDAAGLLGELGRLEQALAIADRALANLPEEPISALRAALLITRSGILGQLGRTDEALENIAVAMNSPALTTRYRLMGLNNLGMTLKSQNKLDAAMDAFIKMLSTARGEKNTRRLMVYALLEIGDIQRMQTQFSEARANLNEALAFGQAEDEKQWQMFAHMYLAELEKAVGNEAAAEQHIQRGDRLQTELRSEAMENRTKVLEVNMELLERESQIERLELESALQNSRIDRNRQRFLLVSVAGLLLLVALWSTFHQARQRAVANRKLDRLARTDSLTGLWNRRALAETLPSLLPDTDDQGPTTLLLMDLDHFKQINDNHGHDHGDAVLIEVAQRIQANTRDEDAAARWGGEEFLIVLPNCSADEAAEVAERFRQAIASQPIFHNGTKHQVTATIGIATLQQGERFESAVRQADAALYRGKQMGRNQVQLAQPCSLDQDCGENPI